MKILEEVRNAEYGWLDRLVFEHAGRVFECESRSVGVSAADDPIASAAQWFYEVDGEEGVAGEAGPDDTSRDVIRLVLEDFARLSPEDG